MHLFLTNAHPRHNIWTQVDLFSPSSLCFSVTLLTEASAWTGWWTEWWSATMTSTWPTSPRGSSPSSSRPSWRSRDIGSTWRRWQPCSCPNIRTNSWWERWYWCFVVVVVCLFLMQRVILWAAFSRLVKIKNTKCVLAEQILCKSKSLQLVKVMLTWGNGRININGISTALVQQSPNVKYKQSLNNLKTIASNLSRWLVAWNLHSVHSCVPANI